MKGATSGSSIGTGTIRGKGALNGTISGASVCNSWFPQKGALIGATTGTSIVAQVSRTVVDGISTITLIAEYDSAI